MANRPCSVCWRAFGKYSTFFSPENDVSGFMQGPQVPLAPINKIKHAASLGCPICCLLSFELNTDFLGPQLRERRIATLQRAMIDPDRAIAVHVDIDDTSNTRFSRVPLSWNNLPLAQLGNPTDDIMVMKAWIDDCARNYPNCAVDRELFVPTRLLDTAAFQNSEDIRLVSRLGLKSSLTRYVALSHCWGHSAQRPITTTTLTLANRMERIEYDKLSLTFQDAIKLTRQLDQRYLWIDSLCIIQDDKDDWAIEAALMAQVYGNSFFTLFALSSKDSTGGCRVNAHGASGKKETRYCDVNTGGGRIRLFESPPDEWHTEYGDNTYKHGRYSTHNSLRTRAWTLQERELSVRGIHFSANTVLWECCTTKASKELPWGKTDPIDDFLPWPMRTHSAEDIEPGGLVSLRERWYGLAEDFSSRSLSYETDKLPALSGLASTFRDYFGPGLYLAGIWHSHLPSALLWKVCCDDNQSPLSTCRLQLSVEYRAPSWSWTSSYSLISYESQRLSNSGGSRPEQNAGTFDYGQFAIVDSQVQLTSSDPFGRISSASLLVRGCLLPLQYHCKKLSKNPTKDDGMRLLIGKDGTTVGACYPDIVNDVQDTKHVYCLSIKGEAISPEVVAPYDLYGRYFSTDSDDMEVGGMVMGLALTKDTTLTDAYRRVGLIRWVKKSLFSNIEARLFTLL